MQMPGDCSPGLAPLDILRKHLLLKGVLSSEAQQGELSKTEKPQGSGHKGLPGLIC